MNTKLKETLVGSFIISLIAIVGGQVIKYIVQIKRPCVEASTCVGSWFGPYDVPSLHAAVAFGLALYLSIRYPKYRTLVYLIAIGVMLQRVLYGVHSWTGVITGAIFGLIVAYVYCRVHI